MVKNPAAVKTTVSNAGDTGSIPRSEDPLEKEWLSTLVFLSGESNGQRSLAG